jgi:SAM-dependent methyltransferase
VTLDVQYGTAAASIYDSLIVGMLPVDDTIERLRAYLAGSRVLELGVGTGRVALPAADLAAAVVGVDNSKAMLDVLRAKPLPSNLSVVEADFRLPLPVEGHFDMAYSALGSLACVESREQLTTALSHIGQVLKPGGLLAFDYYAINMYRPLIELHTVTIPTPHHGGVSTFTTTLDDADVMTMGTRVDVDGEEPVEYEERILLIERDEVTACLAAAGFDLEHVDPSDGVQAYDWYFARRTSEHQEG